METVKAKTKIYDQVVEKVKKMIASGELPQGSALPAERQLIEDLNVSRSSLREGFRILEMMGFIESIPGKGRFVRKSRGEGSQSGRVPLQDEAILELVEARLVLEPAIAVEAAKHASPSDLTRIRRILTKTGKDVESLEHRAQCDYDFHLVLAESTHNFIFVNIVKMTFNLIMATHERIYTLLDDKEIFLREHEEVYDAIVVRDLERAARLMKAHVQRVYKTLQNGIALEEVYGEES
ncbi:MAG: FadR/GntR family transcriptional regulator [Synergistaceae bacterium]|uniref:FadR/GntR family transcriptional regulator n=1 Tax=Aminivibrio sp. TaxID=1872489 RepID=UPI0016A8439E|nr:FadR/GntR family transcriptional regulator [Synergistaceae bacterium]MDD3389812.1 FadR/GntR family transcriptional regulator [Synergistaceae bacterium]MDD3688836.1 FadR/GntR family transcriptional regulator [Synergistaceae bacterium]MDD4021167.1 FadR/GntR family transcriptional regulator [Synergistaceae bacterium]MDD4611910.1 FadR/GntR family transcriptional regulator [Synergistaceae bacterium]